MAEEKTSKRNHKEGCGCVTCQLGVTGVNTCGCSCHQNIWHVLSKILLALIIFWLGVQFGELSVYSENYGARAGTYIPNPTTTNPSPAPSMPSQPMPVPSNPADLDNN